MRRACVLVLVLTFATAFGLLRSSEAASGDVICLHGWNDSASDCGRMMTAYESAGYTFHALSLPRSGSAPGDTAINADYVQAYIDANGLTDVKLDGHSLGGWLALYLTLVRGEDESSVVLRDTGDGCFLGFPGDQCSSSFLAQISSAPASSVPILNLNHSTDALSQVDCLKIYNLDHYAFLTNAAVTAAAVGWPAVNPCGATPTATPIATTTPTATPTPTPTPTCSWWSRLWGRC